MKGGLSRNIPELVMLPHVLQPMSSQVLAEYLLDHPDLVRGKDVLDMGSGSGIQGIAAALAGARSVTLSDLSPHAFANTRENIDLLECEATCSLHKGDLFAPLEGRCFDVIVFAHPYFGDKPVPGLPVTQGMLDDGGLIVRFLKEAPDYLRNNYRILMPFLDIAGTTNDPRLRGRDAGYKVQELYSKKLASGLQKGKFHIYELTNENGEVEGSQQ